MILYPAMASHRDLSPKHRERLGIRDNLMRISVGIEAVEDIIADLDQALSLENLLYCGFYVCGPPSSAPSSPPQWCGDGLTHKPSQLEVRSNEPAGNGGLFRYRKQLMELDFTKLDGLVAAVIQDWKTRPRPDGRLHERGELPQDGRDRQRGVLQPLAQQAVAQGRDVRPQAGGQGNLDRLRSRRRAAQSGGARPRRVPRRL